MQLTFVFKHILKSTLSIHVQQQFLQFKHLQHFCAFITETIIKENHNQLLTTL